MRSAISGAIQEEATTQGVDTVAVVLPVELAAVLVIPAEPSAALPLRE